MVPVQAEQRPELDAKQEPAQKRAYNYQLAEVKSSPGPTKKTKPKPSTLPRCSLFTNPPNKGK